MVRPEPCPLGGRCAYCTYVHLIMRIVARVPQNSWIGILELTSFVALCHKINGFF